MVVSIGHKNCANTIDSNISTGRSLRVVSSGSSSAWFDVFAGVPQGSILGPLLFLVYINDIPYVSGVVFVLFADDLAIWSKYDGARGDSALNRALDDLCDWADRWHLLFSLAKSVTMCFSRKQSPFKPARIWLRKRVLQRVEIFRYLGITVTPDLNWTPHTTRVIASVFHAAFNVARIITKTGPPPRIIRQLVLALVIPVMTYGWPLWCPQTKRHWSKLESAVCLPLRCVLGLPASTEKLALFVEFAIVRPILWRDCCALVFAHRLDVKLGRNKPQHPAHLLFRAEARAFLPRRCPKYRIPFGKAIKTIEYQFGVDHDSDKACAASLRKIALVRQINQIRAPKELQDRSRYAEEFNLCPAPASYIMTDSRVVATLRARIRMNRHHFRSRQWRLKLVDDPHCPACSSFFDPNDAESVPCETPEHVLISCVRFQNARMRCSNGLLLHSVPLTMDVITGDLSAVSAHSKTDIQLATADFLRHINGIIPI